MTTEHIKRVGSEIIEIDDNATVKVSTWVRYQAIATGILMGLLAIFIFVNVDRFQDISYGILFLLFAEVSVAILVVSGFYPVGKIDVPAYHVHFFSGKHGAFIRKTTKEEDKAAVCRAIKYLETEALKEREEARKRSETTLEIIAACVKKGGENDGTN
jgi:hypothetical protein